jgi:hypothetical protein
MSAAEDRSLHLSIPDWLPRHLEDAARTMHASAVRSRSAESIAVVQRLVGDPRMKAVWAELLKRRRADSVFVHEAEAFIRAIRAEHHGRPIRSYLNNRQENALFLYYLREIHRVEAAKTHALAGLKKATAQFKKAWDANPEFKSISGFSSFEEMIAKTPCDTASEITAPEYVETSTKFQLAAMEVVFREAVALGQSFGSIHHWEQTRHSYLERASKARADARFLERAGRHHINGDNSALALRKQGKKLQRSLLNTAKEYEAYANLLAEGQLDNSASIGFMRRMAGTLKDLFGKRLISTVATIASVALDRAITRVMARHWMTLISEENEP